MAPCLIKDSTTCFQTRLARSNPPSNGAMSLKLQRNTLKRFNRMRRCAHLSKCSAVISFCFLQKSTEMLTVNIRIIRREYSNNPLRMLGRNSFKWLVKIHNISAKSVDGKLLNLMWNEKNVWLTRYSRQTLQSHYSTKHIVFFT